MIRVLNHNLEIRDHHSHGSIGLDIEEWFVHVVVEIVNILVLTNVIGEGNDDIIEGWQEQFMCG